ncbi:MAG: hypothetical protein JW951_06795 [Lentisphaerae bacterium]|nr:hypothetical protein [Lentisphaerota bacterium]
MSDLAFETGLTPVFRNTVLSAIAALHNAHFDAVLVDPETAGVDVLECVLNIRDVNGSIPIFVLSERRDGLADIASRAHVSVVNRAELMRQLMHSAEPAAQREE